MLSIERMLSNLPLSRKTFCGKTVVPGTGCVAVPPSVRECANHQCDKHSACTFLCPYLQLQGCRTAEVLLDQE